MSDEWDEVDVPRGAYIGWGNRVGQHVTGKVVSYEPSGGEDFNGNPCPQVTFDLTDKAASFNKEGERTDYPAGDLVVLNCGQVSLKRAVRAAVAQYDDLVGRVVKIELVNLVKVDKGTVKEFSIKVARGGSSSSSSSKQSAPAEEEPPF